VRVMPDTNVLVSAALYPDRIVALAVSYAMQSHTLVVCTYILDELQSVFKRKFPHKTEQLEAFLSNLRYEPCSTPEVNPSTPDM
jgi:predicted nucleic acid-binding protein